MHLRNILADIDDTSANLGNFANMSLDDQVNDRSRSPDHSEEAEDPQPSLTGRIPERERSASLDLCQSERNSNLELEGISDVSQQLQPEIGPDQMPTLTSDADEDAAEAPDPGCQESDCGELVPDEREGAEMIPSVMRDFDLQELSDLVQINDIKIAMEFVRGLESATLDDKEMRLDSEALERL